MANTISRSINSVSPGSRGPALLEKVAKLLQRADGVLVFGDRGDPKFVSLRQGEIPNVALPPGGKVDVYIPQYSWAGHVTYSWWIHANSQYVRISERQPTEYPSIERVGIAPSNDFDGGSGTVQFELWSHDQHPLPPDDHKLKEFGVKLLWPAR